MKQNRLTFQSKNLVVSNLNFMSYLNLSNKILNYLLFDKFNSFDIDKKYRDPVQDGIQRFIVYEKLYV